MTTATQHRPAPDQSRPNAARPHGRPVVTLAAGDLVTVNLKGRAVDRIRQWAGEVLAVDSVAIRLETCWYRLGLSACPSQGERVIPWSQIETVKIEGVAEDRLEAAS